MRVITITIKYILLLLFLLILQQLLLMSNINNDTQCPYSSTFTVLQQHLLVGCCGYSLPLRLESFFSEWAETVNFNYT